MGFRVRGRIREGKGNVEDRKFRVFATCDIGPSIELLRERGYEVEVYPGPEAPPHELLLEKVRGGIDGLITYSARQDRCRGFRGGQGHAEGHRAIRRGI